MSAIVDPMEFVDFELREKLAIMNEMMGGSAIDDLTADLLPSARENVERYARPLLPTPVPQE